MIVFVNVLNDVRILLRNDDFEWIVWNRFFQCRVLRVVLLWWYFVWLTIKNCKVARSNPVATTYLLAERVKASNEKKTISNDRLDKSLYLPMVTYLLLDIHPAVYTCTVYILMCMYITCSVEPVFGYLNMLSINVFSFHMCCWYIGQQ